MSRAKRGQREGKYLQLRMPFSQIPAEGEEGEEEEDEVIRIGWLFWSK
jgi:hypothetical protein